MIIGLGIDSVDIERIQGSLDKFGERFIQRMFTPSEQKTAQESAHVAASFAKRFAAKEACIKALGGSETVSWHDFEITNLDSGRPVLEFHGNAQKRLQERVPKGMKPALHVSLTDTDTLAQAIVILEAVA